MTDKANTLAQSVDLDARVALTDLSSDEIAARLRVEPYRGRQLFQWIHRKQEFDLSRMTDLPKPLRERIETKCRVSYLEFVKMLESESSTTQKALFRLADGEHVESVLMRDRKRITLCLSSQVGCAVKCPFCATGHSGYARNLSAGEIVEQALHLLRGVELGERTPNIVYMGMGEPFRNYDAVVKSIRLLMAREGLNIGARRITVSTVGEIPAMDRFAREAWQVRLSVSLHAANDTLRDELVPLNRKYNLARLKEAIRRYNAATGRQVTLEWTLLKGVNDRLHHAEELVDWVTGLNVFVNLIPYNPVPGLKYEPPSHAECARFRDELIAKGLRATLRFERGQDIAAACGQLRRSELSQAS